ncbi:hypothetical protein K1719_028858 [Acacia pycnantha]|nr:hypothetical protein K1719_028858 [Acacia pycnantha]
MEGGEFEIKEQRSRRRRGAGRRGADELKRRGGSYADDSGGFMGGVGKLVEAESAFMAECLAIKEALRVKEIFCGGEAVIETDRLSRSVKKIEEQIQGCE